MSRSDAWQVDRGALGRTVSSDAKRTAGQRNTRPATRRSSGGMPGDGGAGINANAAVRRLPPNVTEAGSGRLDDGAQREAELGAAALALNGPDPAVHRIDQRLRHEQADPRARRLAGDLR